MLFFFVFFFVVFLFFFVFFELLVFSFSFFLSLCFRPLLAILSYFQARSNIKQSVKGIKIKAL